MLKKITLNKKEISYTVRRHPKAKRLRLTVNCAAEVSLTIPRWVTWSEAESFIRQKAGWILEKVARFKTISGRELFAPNREHYLNHRSRARLHIIQKITEHNRHYQFSYQKISIRNQKTRWGSCSRRGNLNFNYKLFFLPNHLVDYVVVHELCHLKEMNHSRRFWKLVAEVIPEFSARQAELSRQHAA